MSAERDDLEAYRAEMRAWLDANLPRREAGAALRSAHEITPEQLAADRALQRRTYEAGYIGIVLPVEYGGQGLTRPTSASGTRSPRATRCRRRVGSPAT